MKIIATVVVFGLIGSLAACGDSTPKRPSLEQDLAAITAFNKRYLGAINDEAGKVRVVLDETLMRHERLNFHPLVNTRTTGLASADLVKFLRATGHEPLVVPLGQDGPPVE